MERLKKTADDLMGALDTKETTIEGALFDVTTQVAGAVTKNLLGGAIDAVAWLASSTLNTTGKVISSVARNIPVIPIISK